MKPGEFDAADVRWSTIGVPVGVLLYDDADPLPVPRHRKPIKWRRRQRGLKWRVWLEVEPG